MQLRPTLPFIWGSAQMLIIKTPNSLRSVTQSVSYDASHGFNLTNGAGAALAAPDLRGEAAVAAVMAAATGRRVSDRAFARAIESLHMGLSEQMNYEQWHRDDPSLTLSDMMYIVTIRREEAEEEENARAWEDYQAEEEVEEAAEREWEEMLEDGTDEATDEATDEEYLEMQAFMEAPSTPEFVQTSWDWALYYRVQADLGIPEYEHLANRAEEALGPLHVLVVEGELVLPVVFENDGEWRYDYGRAIDVYGQALDYAYSPAQLGISLADFVRLFRLNASVDVEEHAEFLVLKERVLEAALAFAEAERAEDLAIQGTEEMWSAMVEDRMDMERAC